jgi:hypothetical protein
MLLAAIAIYSLPMIVLLTEKRYVRRKLVQGVSEGLLQRELLW